MKIVKKIARNTIFPMIYQIGGERFISRGSPKKTLILCYHGVAHHSSLPYNGRHIPKTDFESHLKYFRKHFKVISLNEAFQQVRRGVVPEHRQIVITFDDGYVNNLEVALPLLEKYGKPATVFATSKPVEDPETYLWSRVADLLRMECAQGVKIGTFHFQARGGSDMVDRATGKSLYGFIKSQSESDRPALLTELIDRYNFQSLHERHIDTYWKMMDGDQLRKLDASPLIEIGSHTHAHHCLTSISAEAVRLELQKSKAILEETIQKEVVSLAFPDGDYNEKVKDIAIESGYQNLLALSYRCADDPQDTNVLPRENVSGTTNRYSQLIHMHQVWSRTAF